MNDKRFIIAGFLGGVAFFIVYFLGGMLLVALAAGVLLFFLIALLLKPKPTLFTAPAHNEDLDALLGYATTSLEATQAQVASLGDLTVKLQANALCKVIQGILKALAEKPTNMAAARKLFHYYLPTFHQLMTTYAKLEQDDLATELTQSLRPKLSGYLDAIETAMKKLYVNLHQKEMLDISVDMEAMTRSLVQDGLLSPGDLSLPVTPSQKRSTTL